MVDDDDYERLIGFNWHRTPCGYAARRVSVGANRQATLLMHREVMRVEPGREVDHKSGDRLDNRKENLRAVTRAQNQMNRRKIKEKTSAYKGVWWVKARSRWQAGIRVNRRLISLGYFENEVEAALAYNRAAEGHFGEYARPNQIPGAEG